jgi:hypothetical protein
MNHQSNRNPENKNFFKSNKKKIQLKDTRADRNKWKTEYQSFKTNI